MTEATFDSEQIEQMIDDRAAALTLARLCTASSDAADPAKVLAVGGPLLAWLSGADCAEDSYCRRRAVDLHTGGVRAASQRADDFTQNPGELLRSVTALYAALHPDVLTGMSEFGRVAEATGTAGVPPGTPGYDRRWLMVMLLLDEVKTHGPARPWFDVIASIVTGTEPHRNPPSPAEYAAIEDLTIRQVFDLYVDAEIADDPCGSGPVEVRPGTAVRSGETFTAVVTETVDGLGRSTVQAGPLDPPQDVLDTMARRGLTEQTHPLGILVGSDPAAGLMGTVQAAAGYSWGDELHEPVGVPDEPRALDPERADWCSRPVSCPAGPDEHTRDTAGCTDDAQ